MIKVYQPLSCPYTFNNPFVYALMDGIDEQFYDIKWIWGYDKFWKESVFACDIMLIQWPDAIIYWSGDKKHTVEDYEKRITEIKTKGVKLISFVHDLEPHYIKDPVQTKCWDIVYNNADILIHMGEYSREVLYEKYPNVTHINLGPHFVFDKVYKEHYTKEQGCAMLGFEPQYKYILAFGAFRSDEERKLIYELAEDLKSYDRNIMIIAPCFKDIPAPKSCFDFSPKITQYTLKHRNHIICGGKSIMSVPDALVPYYYAVSDACILHRKRILNSGNIPMAFLMKKVIAGPNVGNVSEVLKTMGNPAFDINNRNSVRNAVIQAMELSKEGKGIWNYNYAMSHFSSEIFARKMHEVFLNSARC